MRRSCLVLLASLPIISCSWTRFDDIETDTPVVTLKKPSTMRGGFGVNLATVGLADRVQLLVGAGSGNSAAAIFDLGAGEKPTEDATDEEVCVGTAESCHLSSSPAGIPRINAADRDRELCFVVGTGMLSGAYSLITRCSDVSFALQIPEFARTAVTTAFTNEDPVNIALASERVERPVVLAAYTAARLAWFYPAGALAPIELTLPAAVPDASYGAVVTVASVGASRLFAVAAPNEGNVRLFKSDGASATYIGCLGGTKAFGRAMTAGALDTQEGDELVITDERLAYAFSASVLLSLPPASNLNCSLSALPAGALYTSMTCGSTKNVADCPQANFGAAVAVGDLDGDGDGELIVGAPGMTVREQKRAGALVVFDAETPGDAAFREIQFLSSAEEDDELGASLATPRLASRHIIAAGAPRGGKVALFYCSALLPADKRGARCK